MKKLTKKKTKKKPTIAILDGDIIAYKAACLADVEGIDVLDSRIPRDIKKWIPKGVKDIIVAFSCSRKDNFRRDHWADYKKNRDSSDSPDSLGECREFIIDRWDTVVEPRLEADDLIGIHTSSGEMIGVTIDKDLKTIPGFHWNPDKDKDVRYTTDEEADRFFFLQWMTGDSTDGVPGLWRIGPKKANKLLDEWDKDTWFEEICAMYEDEKYNKDAYPEMEKAMAWCIRILRYGEYDFEKKKINLWMPDSWVLQ